MRLDRDSGIAEVVAAVAVALRRRGIDAVLTGGACASIYSGGRYFSRDVDFIILGDVTVGKLDDALDAVGFRRRGNQYIETVGGGQWAVGQGGSFSSRSSRLRGGRR